MTYLLVLLAAQTWSSQEACRETSQFWIAPLTVNVSSRSTLLPNHLTWSWCPSLNLNCSCSVFISQDHPAPLYPIECVPSLLRGFLLPRHSLCVGSTHTGVYLCTEPEATSSSCFSASSLLAFLKRFLCLKCPLLILRKLDIPSICFHSPTAHLDFGHVALYLSVHILCSYMSVSPANIRLLNLKPVTGRWLTRKLLYFYFYAIINSLFLISQVLIIMIKVCWFWEWLWFERARFCY